jgi:predicted RNA-binding Zn-ribbon protein involved in translation (DUF1610 family)
MRATRPALSSRVHRKVCLACGYDGNAIQGHRAESTYACPNCGEDLYARPPRSYAELEGLDEDSVPIPPAADRFRAHATNRRSVWRGLLSLLRRSLLGRR